MVQLTINETNQITARQILVEGNIHISGDLKYVDEPYIPETRELLRDIADSVIVKGDLYLLTDKVDCQECVAYANLDNYNREKSVIIDPDNYFNVNVEKIETFSENMNKSINNVYMDAKYIKLYGKLVCEGNLTVYSDKVWTKIKNAKINKLKSRIKK